MPKQRIPRKWYVVEGWAAAPLEPTESEPTLPPVGHPEKDETDGVGRGEMIWPAFPGMFK